MSISRILGILVIFGTATGAWMVLGAVTHMRSTQQTGLLQGSVSELWGSVQRQQAPRFVYQKLTQERVVRVGVEEIRPKWVNVVKSPNSSDINVGLRLDQRLKGLVWFSLYDANFSGRWSYTHTEEDGRLELGFLFPNAMGTYDRFKFLVNGEDVGDQLEIDRNGMHLQRPIAQGETVNLEIGYVSRGANSWEYLPVAGVARLENFSLAMTTNFAAIDFPSGTMSPSEKTQDDTGWKLSWAFDQVVTGRGIGMVMPTMLQPGELAAELSVSAPISLFLFFLVMFVLDRLRQIGMHPINYLFLASAFFAFHMLFAYSVDHLNVFVAFGVASVTSIFLVVSYLRLVVSARFAFVEAAIAQLVYLVGFSLAHFWAGFTGLTVTLVSIVTLFVLMQWTGRVDWSEALQRKAPRAQTSLS